MGEFEGVEEIEDLGEIEGKEKIGQAEGWLVIEAGFLLPPGAREFFLFISNQACKAKIPWGSVLMTNLFRDRLP